MDAIEKKRRNLEAVRRYFRRHKGELQHIGMTWPLALIRRIDEIAAAAGTSRRAWILGVCEKALAKVEKKSAVEKKSVISPTAHRAKARTARKKRRAPP